MRWPIRAHGKNLLVELGGNKFWPVNLGNSIRKNSSAEEDGRWNLPTALE
jgi:hypothetical protein